MVMKLKNIILASVPAALLASTQPASADEVQSVAAQAIAQATKSTDPPAPPPPLPIIMDNISGARW